MITSVLGIMVCIICLCSATWAWFSGSVSSDSNTLESGRYGLDAFVEDEDSETVEAVKRSDGKTVCTFEEAGIYTVTLKMSADTTVTKGFCEISVSGDTEQYYTAAINTDAPELTFYIDVEEADTAVTFAPAWGLPADEDVANGGTLALGAAGNLSE